jgi:methionine-S-sulfoxide reductase
MAMSTNTPQQNASVILGAGCFWGVEDAIRLLPGVVSTRVGFTGGHVQAPTYEQVCHGGTGHAEAVEVRYDPAATTLEALLSFFWSHHVATGRNVGQYRSIVVCRADELAIVEAVRASVETTNGGEAVTTQVLVEAPFY